MGYFSEKRDQVIVGLKVAKLTAKATAVAATYAVNEDAGMALFFHWTAPTVIPVAKAWIKSHPKAYDRLSSLAHSDLFSAPDLDNPLALEIAVAARLAKEELAELGTGNLSASEELLTDEQAAWAIQCAEAIMVNPEASEELQEIGDELPDEIIAALGDEIGMTDEEKLWRRSFLIALITFFISLIGLEGVTVGFSEVRDDLNYAEQNFGTAVCLAGLALAYREGRRRGFSKG